MLVVGSFAEDGRLPRDLDLVGTYDDLQQITAMRKRQLRGVLSIPLGPNKTALVCQQREAIDGITSYDVRLPASVPIEFEIAWPGSTGSDLIAHAPVSPRIPTLNLGGRLVFPTLDVLYTLKMSHRYLKNSRHFQKTRSDILRMRSNGAKIWDADWLKRREAETYTYDHPSLDATKGDFFKVGSGSSVKYIFDHDSIHEAVARFIDGITGQRIGAPAYTLYKGDGEVMCDREKFFALPKATQLRGVLEEVYVLALERSQIPYGGHVCDGGLGSEVSGRMRGGCLVNTCFIEETRHAWAIPHRRLPCPNARLSFDVALEKVCTSITSGWFREFAWEHYDEVAALYHEWYVDSFWHEASNDRVKMNQPPIAKAA